MFETREQQQVYVKFLVMERPIQQLQNMLGTLRVIHSIAYEEETDLLRKLDYIGYRAKDLPLFDRLEKVQAKIKHIKMLMSLTSEAMLQKASVL